VRDSDFGLSAAVCFFFFLLSLLCLEDGGSVMVVCSAGASIGFLLLSVLLVGSLVVFVCCWFVVGVLFVYCGSTVARYVSSVMLCSCSEMGWLQTWPHFAVVVLKTRKGL
jgi:hypothetical protein